MVIGTTGNYNADGDNQFTGIFKLNSDWTLDTSLEDKGYSLMTLNHRFSSGISGQVFRSDNEFFVTHLIQNEGESDMDFLVVKYHYLYQINGLADNVTATTSSGRSLRTQDGSGIVQENTVVEIKKDAKPIAKIVVDMTEDKDFSGINMESDEGSYRSYIHGLDEVDGVDNSFTLYIPRDDNDQAVGICPGADSLEEIDIDCEEFYTLEDDDSKVLSIEIDGKDYWSVSGVTGTGGISIDDLEELEEELSETGEGILIWFGTLLIVVCVTISGSALLKNKRVSFSDMDSKML